jgi:pimeloyl-ACP methyl ester carboxylesterase
MPSAVFVHGLPDHSGTWEKVFPLLPKSFAAIHLISLPGLTDLKSIADTSSLYDLANELKERLPPAPSVYIGHDFGGILGTLVAQKHPQLISKFILVNAPTPDILLNAIQTDEDQRARSQYAFRIAADPEKVISRNDFAFLKTFLFKDENTPSTAYQDSLVQMWAAPTVQRNIGTYYRAILNANLAPVSFAHKTLQVWSTKDPFLGPLVQKTMRERFPEHAALSINSMSHWPQLSTPKLLGDAIAKFLE